MALDSCDIRLIRYVMSSLIIPVAVGVYYFFSHLKRGPSPCLPYMVCYRIIIHYYSSNSNLFGYEYNWNCSINIIILTIITTTAMQMYSSTANPGSLEGRTNTLICCLAVFKNGKEQYTILVLGSVL